MSMYVQFVLSCHDSIEARAPIARTPRPSTPDPYIHATCTYRGQSADATEADADEAEEGVEEGWTGRLHSTSAEDEEGVSDSSRRRSRRRPKKALPVQLLPSDEGRSEAMMIGLPYRLQASSAPPPPQSGPVALSPLERAAAAVAATAAGPNSPPPMALAAATAAAAPPAAPPAQGAGGGRGGLANELMAAAGWRPAASAAPRPFTKVALVATPDPEAAFDAMAIRRLQALVRAWTGPE